MQKYAPKYMIYDTYFHFIIEQIKHKRKIFV